jgi:hypothetical protein
VQFSLLDEECDGFAMEHLRVAKGG